MAQGFVYILLNPSFPDQVKIGRTEKTSELRAKQLQTTGVPTAFIVVYDELVSNCEVVENILHSRFTAYRTSLDREFFRVLFVKLFVFFKKLRGLTELVT